MSSSTYVPLFEATRGHIVESVQFGAIAVVNSDGLIQASEGDPEMVTFLRSSAKPFQALPFMEAHGDDYFHLTDTEVAIMCASHAGTDEHLQVLIGFQQKIGITEDQLMCGTHPPFDSDTWHTMIQSGRKLTANRHNCSGKHTGMLASARLQGFPLEEYPSIEHPIQQQILLAFSEMVGVAKEQVEVGIDGCSVPTFAVPLRNAAFGYARLADPSRLPANRKDACQRIVRAMTSNPMMIAGPKLFDTVLMDLAGDKFLTKTGAEGFQALSILPDAIEPGSPALGVALKIADGDQDGRARPVVMLELLRQLGAITNSELAALKDLSRRPIYNFRHLRVGEYRPSFSIRS